jgi:hypothetical protein
MTVLSWSRRNAVAFLLQRVGAVQVVKSGVDRSLGVIPQRGRLHHIGAAPGGDELAWTGVRPWRGDSTQRVPNFEAHTGEQPLLY